MNGLIALAFASFLVDDAVVAPVPTPVEHSEPVVAPIPTLDKRKEQQEAVEAIRRLGGEVFYDYQRPNPDEPNFFDPKARPKNPEVFHRVVRVSLRDSKATDDDLKIFAKLPHVENLDLTNTRITGAGLEHLKGLTNLRVLGLWKTRVDDAGLKHIKGLTKMWLLSLDGTNVTDAGLAYLKSMTGLEEWLGLADTASGCSLHAGWKLGAWNTQSSLTVLPRPFRFARCSLVSGLSGLVAHFQCDRMAIADGRPD
jgi:hypothetical protein